MTQNRIVATLGGAIFAIRWLLVPIYLLLYVALAMYCWVYIKLVFELLSRVNELTPETMMIALLQLIDMGMIANLVVITTVGGYSIFVDEFEIDKLPNKPRWLNKNFSSSDQKIKLGMSLIGVAMVHFLHVFVTADHVSWDTLYKQLMIFGVVFLLGTLCFCWINLMSHHKSLREEH